jgi:hypothetical protein
MNEITELLTYWENDGIANPAALKAAHDAIVLLVAKVEALETQIQNLSNTQP